eukprot:3451206-Pyramimonas_sp.AAC.1
MAAQASKHPHFHRPPPVETTTTPPPPVELEIGSIAMARAGPERGQSCVMPERKWGANSNSPCSRSKLRGSTCIGASTCRCSGGTPMRESTPNCHS